MEAHTHGIERQLVVNAPADQVWEWLSDIRNAMTNNVFHLALECDATTASNPRRGLEVPILHGIGGWKWHSIARIAKYEDYEVYWGERMREDYGPDPFPHSEGWKVESLGANECRITTKMRGQHKSPVGALLSKYIWDTAIAAVLDNDLQEVAFKSGAIKQKSTQGLPQAAQAMLRLASAQQIDGMPAIDYLTRPIVMK